MLEYVVVGLDVRGEETHRLYPLTRKSASHAKPLENRLRHQASEFRVGVGVDGLPSHADDSSILIGSRGILANPIDVTRSIRNEFDH